MACGESNRHVTDDVTWPWKVKVVTPSCLIEDISRKPLGYDSDTMEHLWEIAYGEQNDPDMFDTHQKCSEVQARFQWTFNRKWRMENPMVTWPMTSRDLERWKLSPRYVWSPCPIAQYCENGMRYGLGYSDAPVTSLSCAQWRQVTLQCQDLDADVFRCLYLEIC